MIVNEDEFSKRLAKLRIFQEFHSLPVTDIATQNPVHALHSLRESAERAPTAYQDYLREAIDCYEHESYRGAILMVWSAAVEHLYQKVGHHRNGLKLMQAANESRFSLSSAYKPIRKKDDLLYLSDKNFLMLAEDAGLLNKNARMLLEEKLILRNRCGHPTQYRLGREEAVVFIESLIINIIGDAMVNW